jgi:cyclic beta-1,2-glucan synthetase
LIVIVSNQRVHKLDNNFFIRRFLTSADDGEPIRAELFSGEQMAQYGKTLALSHKLASTKERDRLLSRLAVNEQVLINACRLLTEAVNANRRITPAAEWLLDNFHLIEDQIRTAKRHLPSGYSRELPCLARVPQTASSGLPRVYDLALQIISHGDARLDADSLTRFVSAYQSVSVLNLGELWAIPIMLRLALIENIRRMAIRIVSGMVDRDLANTWADQMIDIAESDPKSLILIIADMARSNPPMSSPFVSELARRLQGQSTALALALTWIERTLAETNQTIEALVQIETQKQAASQVYISNSIASLNFLSAMNWRDFVEDLSFVEQVLRQDIGGVYAKMDFATRDRYRHVIEMTARLTSLTEQQVAEHAIRLAKLSYETLPIDTNSNNNNAAAHVGYYLIDAGLVALERATGVNLPIWLRLRRKVGQSPLLAYLGTVTLFTALASLLPIYLTWIATSSVGNWLWTLYLTIVLSLVWASQFAIGITNWLVSLLVTPSLLPRMDYEAGMPESSRTLIVVPCMLSSSNTIIELLAKLEVRFLANRDAHLHIGLLTDFTDAVNEKMPSDDEYLAQIVDGIKALNNQYANDTQDRFFLFHRARSWNKEEQIWMGYERKRGKICDLNHYLRSSSSIADDNISVTNRFSCIIGATDILTNVKYVITLDADTHLPRDAAKQFAATIAHPLNAASSNNNSAAHQANHQHGYAILQPRVAVSMPLASRSRYARLFGSQTGIDPYTRAVSDVYQDAFSEGSFIGKGIYDVDAFEASLDARFPTNRILSHDLLEGCYARAALISDLHLYEEFPSRYRDDMSRRHRWIRGDWQIASWLLRRVPGLAVGNKSRSLHLNPLSMLSQWKIFDNLRRSLVPISTLILLLQGWLILPAPLAMLWTLMVMGLSLAQPLAASLVDLLIRPNEVPIQQYMNTLISRAAEQLLQVAFAIAMMPFEAYSNVDAIVRTNWRVLISHRNLLQWMPSVGSDAAKTMDKRNQDQNSLLAHYQWMCMSPIFTIAVGMLLLLATSHIIWIALPFLLMWLAAPTIAWWMSLPQSRNNRQAELDTGQINFLRHQARKTWAFFSTFVGSMDNWLPPDNVQEHPVTGKIIIAHRTSPTNIGLALLANLSAYDFGYISCGQLLTRTRNSVTSMSTLARYEGHFYNWYDTQTCQPMSPMYISTVDSGNLVGHLLTLRVALLQLPHHKIVSPRLCEGLVDTLSVLNECIANDTLISADLFRLIKKSQTALAAICEASDNENAPLMQTYSALKQLAATAHQLVAIYEDTNRAANTIEINSEWELAPSINAMRWAIKFDQHCQDALAELRLFAPWLSYEVDKLSTSVALSYSNANGIVASHHTLHKTLATTTTPSLHDVAHNERYLAQFSVAMMSDQIPRMTVDQRQWLIDLQAQLLLAREAARQRLNEIEQLSHEITALATMSYGFLYDSQRHLFSIGYNVTERRQDASFYDMLASEARLCTFVAIAQGDISQESWFRLGRLLTPTNGAPALLSWSGSMFEYLMPLLVMPNYQDTLLDDTYAAVVKAQITYAAKHGVAWGISESGYNLTDASLNYQYRAFGVPGLGLKRGLADDLVIAPYASALALMVLPQAACINLIRLDKEGLTGDYGFYEAVDYTKARLLRGQTRVVIRSFMAHHQGMVLLSLASVLLKEPMQARFMAEPKFQATMLLLQERVPKIGALPLANRFTIDSAAATSPATPVRIITRHDTTVPEVQLLSNGRYHVMLTNAGGGSSRWKDIAVTRWREDITRDNYGSFCYLRDLSQGANGQFWSNTHQPTLKQADRFEAIFTEGRAEFRRQDHDIDTYTEVVVSPEDDIELRRVHLTNRGYIGADNSRTIEVTTYAEVVIAPATSDALHPVFSNLFVQTEILHAHQAILCTRRPRSQDEQVIFMFHLVAVRHHPSRVNGNANTSSNNNTNTNQYSISYETDRMQFIGRGRSLAFPQVMLSLKPLSGTHGSVLDPIVSIRSLITLASNETITIDIVTGVADTREAAIKLIDKYHDARLADRVLELAWTHSLVSLRQINATQVDAQLYARLANAVIYANPALRADALTIAKNRRTQSGLWGYAISGDLPIVLLQIADTANIELVRQLVQAHTYWRRKGLVADLVIWNEDRGGYRQVLQEQITGLIAAGIEAHVMDRPGGIFVRSAEHLSPEDRVLFESVARIVVKDSRGTLADQLNQRMPFGQRRLSLPYFKPTEVRTAAMTTSKLASIMPIPALRALQFDNTLGGFSEDGKEYIITITSDVVTPLPWVNVLANPQFGSVISESGMAYTWRENAHEYRLTPWHNDPINDASGEAIYIRDEQSGYVWSPTRLPCVGEGRYTTRHGFGYSVFEHIEDGIQTTLTVFVALEDAIKFSILNVVNLSGRARQLTVTGYVEWVLGDMPAKTAMHVTTEIDAATGALIARNTYHAEFASRVAFFDTDDVNRVVTADRMEFLGRGGNMQYPAAMRHTSLSGKTGAAMDPCAAIRVIFSLSEGESRDTVFRLGAGQNIEEARALLLRNRRAAPAAQALAKVRQYWQDTLGVVQITTPDPAIDVLVNGWLLYQTLACRVWARSGYYQSGGAFGFRDQLQDVMALIHTQPERLREHLLTCAGRQFREGDVQHWWHPPSGRGVRTHCSDDYLWLPLAICRYIKSTHDITVLDEMVHFLEGRPVNLSDDSYYDLPARSDEVASLYEHCVRAIKRSLVFGSNGLPLMGGGDWNDGMNMVGKQGRGESVWLGFFLCTVLREFADIATLRLDTEFANACLQAKTVLAQNIEANGWDGQWYRRAYFDDGTPLGSATNEECKIDSIAQSWSVLSGVGNIDRKRIAMQAFDDHLVREADMLIQLLAPPFDKSKLDPGYIRGYVPGVRENGGQYTHAAIWAAMAFAALGNNERAWQLSNMINPVNHAKTKLDMHRYMIEPYVVAADVYGVAPHTGRGGWSWYTGSAGWMYRLLVESLLGLSLEGDRLRISPCLPHDWQGYQMVYRYRQTHYHINLMQIQSNAGSSLTITVDGVTRDDNTVELIDDVQHHRVEVVVEVTAALAILTA